MFLNMGATICVVVATGEQYRTMSNGRQRKEWSTFSAMTAMKSEILDIQIAQPSSTNAEKKQRDLD